MTPHIDASYRKGSFGAWLGILGNLFLGLVKFIAGFMGSSSAMMADAIHSLSDMISSAVVLMGLRMARKRPDEKHPYGHSKAESVSAEIVSILLVFLAGMIFLNSLRNIYQSHYHEPSAYLLIIAAFSIAVKEALYQYKIRLGKKLHSSSLVADAWHHRSDAFSSIAVLIGIFLSSACGEFFRSADQVTAIIVALIIGYTGLKLLKETSSELMDQVVTGEPAERIRRIAESVSGVIRVEKLFIRKSGIELFIDIHIEVDPEITVREGHNIAREARRALMNRIPSLNNAMVHIEPYAGRRQ
jgi:cation diffusion facilitator family transporter